MGVWYLIDLSLGGQRVHHLEQPQTHTDTETKRSVRQVLSRRTLVDTRRRHVWTEKGVRSGLGLRV